MKTSQNFANQAIERLAQEGLPVTPKMFSLFYNYYSGENSEIVRAIDIMAKQGFELTVERCDELYRLHIDQSELTESIEKAQRIVGRTLSSVDDIFDSFKSSNVDLSASMDIIQSDVAKAVSPEELKGLLVKVMAEARNMVVENQNLERKLENSAAQMKQLKSEIEAIREEAYTDSLTGIPNRKKFDMEIIRFIAEAEENKEPLSLAFIDIDHFKSFNDAFGHQIGDQVLRLVATNLTKGLKGQDFVCRYGGEEFVVVMPKTASKGASQIINILRETIKNKEIRHRKTGESLTKITFSAGVATLNKGEDTQTWIERADHALYNAKRKGRDCVVVSEKE